MEITLSSLQSRRFCYIDDYENYMTLDTQSQQKSEGIIYRNQQLVSDFALFVKKDDYLLLNSRYDDTETKITEASFTVKFIKCGLSLECAMFENSLYFNAAALGKNKAFIVLICSIEIAKKLDKMQGISGTLPFTIEKPESAELLQITKVFGKKASYARIIKFESAEEIYIALDHSPSLAGKRAKKLLSENAFQKHRESLHEKLSKTNFVTDLEEFNEALRWSKFSAYQFKNGTKNPGLWAGLPWFRDYWGRDIFVSIPGALLLSGDTETAENIFYSYAKYQDKNPRSITYGRFPNVYRNSADIIYNTADASLWFIREALETARFTGNKKFLEKLWNEIHLSLECDRTLRTDSSGFLLHGDADTWMDARIFGEKSFAPRGNRANDIQALWYTALLCGSEIARLLGKSESQKVWFNSAQKVKSAFEGIFFDGKNVADCILKDDAKDFRIRPNQLMLITIPEITGTDFVSEELKIAAVHNAVGSLLFPYGICSLSQDDKYFHPYHDTSPLYHKDAAYHNGTIWNWNAGFTIGSLCMTGHQDMAWELAKNIASQVLNEDVAGSLSENLSAYPNQDGSLHASGAYSTCRGNAEFIRSIWQYFLGVQINMLEKKITIKPHFPSEWKNGKASLVLSAPHAATRQFKINFSWEISKDKNSLVTVSLEKNAVPIEIECHFESSNIKRTVNPGVSVSFAGKCHFAAKSSSGKSSELKFAKPLYTEPDWKKPECLLQKNYLAEITLANKFNGDHPVSLTAIRNQTR